MYIREISIALLLAALLFMAFISYKLMHHYYGKELTTRLNPIHERKDLEVKSTKYWFIGDSRIAHWDNIAQIIPPERFCNLGIDGQTSAQVLERARYYFKTDSADYVFIQVGINDLKTIGFYPGKYQWIKELTKNNLISLIDLCIENKADPVFISIFPTGRVELKRKLFWNDKIDVAVNEINLEIAAYCKQKSVSFFDGYQILRGENSKMNQTYEKDCLHLNEQGYQTLNKKLKDFINTTK